MSKISAIAQLMTVRQTRLFRVRMAALMLAGTISANRLKSSLTSCFLSIVRIFANCSTDQL